MKLSKTLLTVNFISGSGPGRHSSESNEQGYRYQQAYPQFAHQIEVFNGNWHKNTISIINLKTLLV